MNLGLYVHIPFCRFKCTYCDFNAYAGMRSLYEPYARAVKSQISNFKSQISNARAETIYFGGGTPSLLPQPFLAEIVSACRESFDVPPEAEISLEANPGTVDANYLEGLRALGVNRLSLGVQSAHQSELDFFKRGHSFADAVESVRLARAAGFANLNVDLIYGLPQQTMALWQETVDRALGLAPDHVSMYCLTVEERTTLALWVRRGKTPLPDDDLAADMVLWADERLASTGLMRYEVSNWARPGRQCQHNLVYWRNAPYLGFGAGAHSSFNGQRFWNVDHPREFVQRIEAEQSAVAGSEVIGRELEMGETMMLGLRLVEGVSLARFESRFGLKLTDVYSRELEALQRQELIEMDETGVRLTRRGWLLGDRVFSAFLPLDR
jgi:oxygen-independent coproporphyrinogen-3 oxidase